MLKPLLLAAGLVSISILSAADPSGTTRWIEGRDDLIYEFCQTSWPLWSDTCGVPLRPTAIFEFPTELGKVVETHVRQAAAKGYYEHLSMDDFFHGHLILRGPQTEFASPEELFKNVSYILYHTAEYTDRWEKQANQGVPTEARNPRSLIGYSNGDLVTAQSVVHSKTSTYERSGTIYGGEVVSAIPGSSSLDYDATDGIPSIFVHAGGSDPAHLCQADSLEFYIMPSTTGAYRTPDGRPMTIFLRCVQNSIGSQVGYSVLPRIKVRPPHTM